MKKNTQGHTSTKVASVCKTKNQIKIRKRKIDMYSQG
jgi:hypothetical protein